MFSLIQGLFASYLSNYFPGEALKLLYCNVNSKYIISKIKERKGGRIEGWKNGRTGKKTAEGKEYQYYNVGIVSTNYIESFKN